MKLLDLARMARKIGVTQKWLKEAAERGEIPALRADNRLIFNVEATEKAVAKLAAEVAP